MLLIDWTRDSVLPALPALISGLAIAILIVLAAAILGGAGGVAIWLTRQTGGAAGRALAGGWSVVFRALPVLVSMVLLQQVLPFAGLRLTAVSAAILALALAFSAATAEALRQGGAAVPRRQIDTARLLGVPGEAILRDILWPQTWRAALPAQADALIQLARDGALAAAIAVPDLLARAREGALIAADPTPLILAALVYLALLIPARIAADRLALRQSQAARP